MKFKRIQNPKQLSLFAIITQLTLFFVLSLSTSYFLFHNSPYFPLGSPSYIKHKKQFHDKWIQQGINFINSDNYNYLQNINSNVSDQSQTKKICIAILTRKRTTTYISTMVASLFLGNQISEITKILEINILNTHDDPKQHNEVLQLKQKLPLLNLKNSTEWNRGSIEKWHVRENYDYLAALQTCEKSSANWTIIFEEDIVLMNNFIPIFNSLIANKKAGYFDNVGYVKLWTTDRWDGFENQDAFLLITFCIILSIFVTIVIRIIFQTTSMKKLYRCQNKYFVLTGFFLFLIILSNSLLIGKQQLFSFFSQKKHHLKLLGRNHGSGTPAIAYSKQQLVQTINYLEQIPLENSLHIDQLIGKQMLKQFPNLNLLEVSPSLVQHIGAYSSSTKNNGDFRKLSWDSNFRIMDS